MVVLHFPEQASTPSTAIKWCAVGHAETVKCDTWSINSLVDDNTVIECESAPTAEECMKKIMVKQSWMEIWESVTSLRFFFCSILRRLSQLPCSVKRLTQWQWMEDRCTQRGSVVWFPLWWSSMMKVWGLESTETISFNHVFYFTFSTWVIF